MKATPWEQVILSALLQDPDGTYIVTEHSSKIVHLWLLVCTLFPKQAVFMDRNEFRENVFCDCVAERPGRVIPEDATRVYVHTLSVRWNYIDFPSHVKNIYKETA